MTLTCASIEIDGETDTRLRQIAAERGQGVPEIVAEAVALLDAVVDADGLDIAEDRRRLDEFNRTGLAVPMDEIESWVASWGSAQERPRPTPREQRK